MTTTFTRRRFLAGAAGLAGAAVGLGGCGSSVSISSDPRELVLWYWNRSISPTLLEQAAKQIPSQTSTYDPMCWRNLRHQAAHQPRGRRLHP